MVAVTLRLSLLSTVPVFPIRFLNPRSLVREPTMVISDGSGSLVFLERSNTRARWTMDAGIVCDAFRRTTGRYSCQMRGRH